MKNHQFFNGRFTLLALIATILMACYEQPLTPSQTVQQFWSALLTGDVNKAGDYATTETQAALLEVGEEFKDTAVAFGKIQIESDHALIETTLTKKLASESVKKPAPTTFNTVLDKQNELWKVNYAETRKSLDDAKQKKGLSKLVDDLEKLGRDVTGQLGGVLKNWEEVTPEIKKDLENLGESVQKQLQDSIDQHGPELQEKLQEFTESLDDAIKDLEKSLPAPGDKEETEEPNARMI